MRFVLKKLKTLCNLSFMEVSTKQLKIAPKHLMGCIFTQMDGSSYQKMDATNGKCPLKPFASQITEMASNFPFFVVLFL